MRNAKRIAIWALGFACAGVAVPAQQLSTYGTPGVIEMPSAEVLNDGELALTTSAFGATVRNTLTFQMLPWVHGSFRYAYIEDFSAAFRPNNQSLYDRSFDIHFQLLEETPNRPALALGLRDFGGTGVLAGEYLVATKTFGERLSVTGGLGWGRLATQGEFESPFCWIAERFCTRPLSGAGGIPETGQLDFANWFRGDAAFFGGVRYKVNDRLTLLGEYSSDAYVVESDRDLIEIESPFNFGLRYRFSDGISLSGYYLYGSEFGFQLSYVFDPAQPRNNAGLGIAAPATVPVDRVALASWNLPDRPPGQRDATDVLASRMEALGLLLEAVEVSGGTALVRVENLRYGSGAQAVGRANRVLANTLPPEVTRFVVVLSRRGLPITRIETARADFYELETDFDGSWRSLARARITDSHVSGPSPVDGVFPRFDYRLSPYAAFSFFDPDNPFRYDFGAQFSADWTPRPRLNFSTQLRQPIIGTIADATRQSNSVLPRVRSDWVRYAQESELEINHLTAEYLWRPRQDIFARVTAGYLEPMFGGLSAEMLWYPVDSRIALGAEINYARQREFDMLFGFQDYDVITGHGSIYYDTGTDYQFQLDVGRYLAGDWGATVSVDREFNNGFKVGGFFTLTDVPFDDFGEGSFDKGIRIEVPLSWLTGRPTRGKLRQVIRPILRDGGARLAVPNRLYEFTRQERGTRLASQWGRYFR